MVISFVWQKSFLASFTHQREYPRRSELKFQFWKSKSLTWKKFWLNDTNGWIQSFTDCAKHILFISFFCSCESVSFHFANQEGTCNIENNNIINLFPNPDSSVFWSFIKFCRIVIYSRDEAELCALVAGIWRHSCESWCKNAFDTNFNYKIQRLKHLNEINWFSLTECWGLSWLIFPKTIHILGLLCFRQIQWWKRREKGKTWRKVYLLK